MQILIADDDAVVRSQLVELLKAEHDVVACEDGVTALRALSGGHFDLVITDNVMPGLTGLELIRRGKASAPACSFLLMTANGSVAQAVEAIQYGANDYIVKPFADPEIKVRVARIAKKMQPWTPQASAPSGVVLIGRSPNIEAAKKFIQNTCSVNSPVLILGPSGSGKEVLARSIHDQGSRANRPFVAVNCASLSEQLIESELFGHEKGAFTGAATAKPGKFEIAKGGTLFLDEIGELNPAVQARLLRVIQEKEFFRVGGVKEIKADVRLIAATHRDLKTMTANGGFREDLLFRLDVLSFRLAPLRERREDVVPLVEFFWKKLGTEFGRSSTLSEEALAQIVGHEFPGNVRELQNLLERLMVMGPVSGMISGDALPADFQTPLPTIGTSSIARVAGDEMTEIKRLGLNGLLDQLEERLIRAAMQACDFNQMRAAELLQVTRGALQYKLKKYAITAPAGAKAA
jgi:DNA-binding NtrC family response regulator